MSLNESIVEDAALEWFLLRQGCGGQVGKLDYVVGHGPHLDHSFKGEPPRMGDNCGA